MFERTKIFLQKTEYYPLILVSYPIFALYTFNIQHVPISDILRILFIAISVILLGLLILGNIIRDSQKTALYISAFIFLFFSYGHIFALLENVWPEIRHRLLLIIWTFLFFLTIFLIWKNNITEDLTKVIRVISIILIGFQGFLIGQFEINRLILNRSSSDLTLDLDGDLRIDELPDIYFIVLDAHTNSKVLQEKFGYDNTPVIADLQELGFYVAECSQSNYTRTEYSITSTLTMEYIDDFMEISEQLPDYEFSYTLQFLKNYGYQMVKFETKADHNLSFGEDIYLVRDRETGNLFNVFPFTRMNAFEAELIQTTWLQPVLTLLLNFDQFLPDDWVLDVETAKYYENYNQVFYMLEELPKLPYMDVDGPKFVYAHFLLPHEPYIFHPSGRYEFHKRSDEYRLGYANNVEFIDTRLPDLLEKIINRSDIPPIIIVMGDHGSNGPDPYEMLPILNMYFLPDGGERELYPSISPVNTFRVILNHYFNTDFELLEDFSYFGNDYAGLKEYDNFCDVGDQ